ncbi:unnamed protein product [Cyprideis torosa]|uniref:Uncharacterized protein n=1 Tax=Cyprideis torosa TaxID=163714 RepID=A0A7R8WIK1_9CRUS|nr:unnamed protein product [Cyprideis torosa]CAG0898924.1 unnamed protein product [Cyprideis torosa]
MRQVLYFLGYFIVLFACVQFRIPQPPEERVRAVFGDDPFAHYLERKRRSGFSELDDHDSEDDVKPLIVGHRGAALDAPENSISGFRWCKSQGIGAVEFDVMITKDGIPIIFHDDTVDRVTSGEGRVADLTYDELQQFDLGEKFPIRREENDPSITQK